jgi:hypothetical protein
VAARVYTFDNDDDADDDLLTAQYNMIFHLVLRNHLPTIGAVQPGHRSFGNINLISKICSSFLSFCRRHVLLEPPSTPSTICDENLLAGLDSSRSNDLYTVSVMQ